jgi:hypothetical protein
MVEPTHSAVGRSQCCTLGGASGGCEAPGIGGLTACGELNQGGSKVWEIGGDSAVMAAMTTPVAELPTTLAEAHALILALAEERAAIEGAYHRR